MHPAPRRARRAAGLLGSLTAAFVAAAVVWVPVATPAAADPPLTTAEAKAQIAELQVEAEALDQQYVGVKVQVDQGRAKLEQKNADLTAETARLAQMKRQVGQVALAQFQNRNLDTAAQLFFTTDADGFLSQVSTVQKFSENQNSVLQDFQQQQADLSDLQRSAEADLAVLTKQEAQLAELRTASEKKITDSKAVLAKLTQQEQRILAEEEQKAAEAAQKQADAASGTGTGTGNTTDPGTPAGSSRGLKALAFAKAQIGKPYRFAAAGPSAYDCSGLTFAAWKSVGVILARTSEAQFHDGRPVAKSDLQPGDLVFFYSGISHVAIYAGNGLVVHAPHPGSTVRYIKMAYMPFAGARRPG